MTNIVTDTHWEGKNLPPLSDHAFMRLLRVQVHTTKPLARIALELGVDLSDLMNWIDQYKDPPKLKRDAPLVNAKYGPPIGQPKRATGWSLAEQSRRQSAWERQRAGAAEARKAMAE